MEDSPGKAATEPGEEVVLYADGTWTYLDSESEVKEIPVNKKAFKKSKNASFLLKSSRVNLGFWLDPICYICITKPAGHVCE